MCGLVPSVTLKSDVPDNVNYLLYKGPVLLWQASGTTKMSQKLNTDSLKFCHLT